jgi:adenylate kinase family enzyme
MKRILIIGCSGGGKSTLARKLGDILSLPVVHLDVHFWKSGWIEPEHDEWIEKVKELIAQDKWIMDGNFGETIPIRVEVADTVIFLDTSRLTQLYGVFTRVLKFHGKTRPDLPEGCPEKFDWVFTKWVWNYNKRNRPKVLKFLENYKESKNIIILKKRKEMNNYAESLKTGGI